MLNIDGYTIERPIHGNEKGRYNNFQPWRSLKLLPKFVATDYETRIELPSGRLGKDRD